MSPKAPIEMELEEEVEQIYEEERKGVLRLLWYYHPIFFLALSLVTALVAWILVGSAVQEVKPRSFETLYTDARTALHRAVAPDLVLSTEERRRLAQSAYVDLRFLLHHHRERIEADASLVNPYLLFAEAAQVYAKTLPVSRRRGELFEEALWGYTEAIRWEKAERSPEASALHAKQFSVREGTSPTREELAFRLERRLRYLRFRRGEMALACDRLSIAQEELERGLREELEREEIARHRLAMRDRFSRPFSDSGKNLFPLPFELTAEEHALLHYHLGVLFDRQGRREEAERAYRTFLFLGGRSRERFLALLRLGEIAIERSEVLLTQGRSGESLDPEVRRVARRLLLEATGKFTEVIDASAPWDLLRQAYFRGGAALLRLAEIIAIERENTWDLLHQRGQDLQAMLERLWGRPLPEESRRALPAIGTLLLEEGWGLPSVVGIFTRGIPGGLITLAMAEHRSPRTERMTLLQRTRLFLSGARGDGPDPSLDLAVNLLTARSLLVEGRYEEAQALFRRTMTQAAESDVDLQSACRIGLGLSYLLQGKCDRAKVLLLGGVEKATSSLLTEDEIRDWAGFCRNLYAQSQAKGTLPGKRIWEFLSPPIRDIVREAAIAGRFPDRRRTALLHALNDLLRRRDFYEQGDFLYLFVSDSIRELLERDPDLRTPEERQRIAEAPLFFPDRIERLLRRDRDLLREEENAFLNRMLLDRTFPSEIVETDPGVLLAPLPPGDRFVPTRGADLDTAHATRALGSPTIPRGLLISEAEIMDVLLRLSRSYQQQARDLMAQREKGGIVDERGLRRMLADATDVNEFLLAYYHPDRDDLLMETADLYVRRAELSNNLLSGRELLAQAGRTYLRVSEETSGSVREEEALLRAGRSFYAAGQYERAAQTLERFAERYEASERIGQALNLLGRAYVHLGQMDAAIRTYRDNSRRQTPDGRKSLYYLGWVWYLVEHSVEEQTGKIIDRIGNPESPYPELREGEIPVLQTALHAFNEVRRASGIAPDSRPWRWATFDLGLVWYRMAERAEQKEMEEAPSSPPRFDRLLPLWRKAEAILRESLERYPVKRSPEEKIGLDPATEPEDYEETLRLRLRNTYYLARVLHHIGRQNDTFREREEARALWEGMIQPDLYPERIFEEAPTRLTISWNALGEVEGPILSATALAQLRRHAFFLLGQSYYEEGERRLAEGTAAAEEARRFFNESLRIYQRAHDRLGAADKPAVLYGMAEVLRKLGRQEEAERKYELARSAAKSLESTPVHLESPLGPAYWRELAENRLQEQKSKERR